MIECKNCGYLHYINEFSDLSKVEVAVYKVKIKVLKEAVIRHGNCRKCGEEVVVDL